MTWGGIAYVVLVSGVITLAARAADEALRLQGRPRRWVWTAGLAATAVLPLAPLLLSGGRAGPGSGWWAIPAEAGAAVRTGTVRLVDGAGGASAAGPAGGALGAIREILATPVPDAIGVGLAAAWAAASLAFGGFLAVGWIQLRRRRRRWPRGRAAGEDVRISREMGPAAAGVLRPFLIVPAWLFRRPPPEIRMAVAHEREHARARDPALLAAAQVIVALVPWNPFLWWQLGRLRLAVELDCDRRLLESGLARRDYGELLLEVTASRPAGLLRPVATLRETPSHLEERIRAMTDSSTRFDRVRSLLMAGLSLVLAAGACEAPTPPAPSGGGDEQPPAADEARRADGIAVARGDSGIVVEGEGARVWIAPESERVRLSGISDAARERRAVVLMKELELSSPGDGRIRIRGTRAIEAADRPLVVVDGERVSVPEDGRSGTMRDARDGFSALGLQPDEIESIEVVKGQAAVDAYGEAAASGVVVITTKAGAGG